MLSHHRAAMSCFGPRQEASSLKLRAVALAMLAFSCFSWWPAQAQLRDLQHAEPEPATGRTLKPASVAQHHMIVTANPYATAAGLEILRAGGSAVDASIAAQLVLALVEPQSSGLGKIFRGLFGLKAPPPAQAWLVGCEFDRSLSDTEIGQFLDQLAGESAEFEE